MDYSSSRIHKTVWGEFSELEGGTWETMWQLGFAVPGPAGGWEIYSDERIGFVAKLRISEEDGGELRISTRCWALSAEYYSPTFKSFSVVNDSVAAISTIQGLPRDWYAPFRDRIASVVSR
ncbi:hypothetical protein NS506_02642 [Nocardia seriolae]|uniref:Uncharacterized protein n=1 Tax=Nocardia seriolae TaxID=37332 RepID=A0ABC8AR63_9NOCA|nr:hypothetical protein NS506_02642 [Nocardia seriolae]